MTVASTPPLASYVENGVTRAFPVPFQFMAAGDLAVTRISPAGAPETALLGTDYAVAGGGGSSGTITLSAARNGWKLKIRRATARSQPTDYTVGDTFPAESHERALDRVTMVAQEIGTAAAEAEGRALRVGDGETLAALPAAAARASALLGFDAGGAPTMIPRNTFRGANGLPGGDLGAVGPYLGCEGMELPPFAVAVRTSGYAAAGDLGAATFAMVNAKPPLGPSFQDKSGRWFGLAEPEPSNFMFGALPGATPAENGVRLNEFFAYCAADKVSAARAFGMLSVDRALVLDGGALVDSGFKQMSLGGLVLTMTAPLDGFLLDIRNFYRTTFSGLATLIGTGGTAFSSRTVKGAVRLFNVPRCVFTGFTGRCFSDYGLYFDSGGSANFASVGLVSFQDCGSGHRAGAFEGQFTANVQLTRITHPVTGAITFGPAADGLSSDDQRSILSVSAAHMPPEHIFNRNSLGRATNPVLLHIAHSVTSAVYDGPPLGPRQDGPYQEVAFPGATPGEHIEVAFDGAVPASGAIHANCAKPGVVRFYLFNGSHQLGSVVDFPPGTFTLTRYSTHFVDPDLIDRQANTIGVYPWVRSSRAAGNFHLRSGGVLALNGGDNACVSFGVVEGRNCGTVLQSGALYGPRIGVLSGQSCGGAMLIGSDEDDAHIGGEIGILYCENNVQGVVKLTASDPGMVIHNAATMEFGKCFAFGARKTYDGHEFLGANFSGMNITKNGVTYEFEKPVAADLGSKLSAFQVTSKRFRGGYSRTRDGWNIEFAPFDHSIHRLYGWDSATLRFDGSGANNAPTGTFTFKPFQGQRINGGTAATLTDHSEAGTHAAFSGFTGPALFHVRYIPATDNIEIDAD